MDKQELDKVILSLTEGNVVAIPTETVYGLAASIQSEAALKKIFSVKNRPFFDPLIVHVSGIEMAKSVVSSWPSIANYLAEQFWPGPFTMVLPKSNTLNPLITSGLDSVAVRAPAHPITLEIIKTLNIPLAAPSANQFGKTSPTSADHVKNSFPERDFLVLDGGPSLIGIESTVVSIDEKNKLIKLLRPGTLSFSLLQEKVFKFDSEYKIEKSQKGASPGLLENHYQPEIPLVIVDKEDFSNKDEEHIQKIFQLDHLSKGVELTLSKSANLAARELYSELRSLSNTKVSYIFFKYKEYMKEESWDGIRDRLKKASSLIIDS
ncbi:MAG: L-threonylcarbamoyladenylate synthase [Oligoflexia bacterium]|nr:L-threonylcarbamoyladenylate synthase [Oligoflexia bacterium]